MIYSYIFGFYGWLVTFFMFNTFSFEAYFLEFKIRVFLLPFLLGSSWNLFLMHDECEMIASLVSVWDLEAFLCSKFFHLNPFSFSSHLGVDFDVYACVWLETGPAILMLYLCFHIDVCMIFWNMFASAHFAFLGPFHFHLILCLIWPSFGMFKWYIVWLEP